MRFLPLLIVLFFNGSVWGMAELKSLTLHAERQNESDLEITFQDKDSKDGPLKYIVFEDLLDLPTQEVMMPLELFDKDEDSRCRVLMVSDFIQALPEGAKYDTLIALCTDGYFSYYPEDFIKDFQPFFVLQIEDKNPADWKRTESGGWMGPYLILVSEKLSPQFKGMRDNEHKLPWGVNHIKLANYESVFAPLYTGKLKKLSASQTYGRQLYLENCSSCHAWGDKRFGGSKSNRTFPVIASHAAFNQKYFLDYMKNPQAFMPESTMPAQTHYGEKEMTALIDFMKKFMQ